MQQYDGAPSANANAWPRFRRSGSVPADAQASLDWRPKDIALAARAIRNRWLSPRGRPAQRGGLPLFGFRKTGLAETVA